METQQELAIASVPAQSWGQVYDQEKALRIGTIFKDLNKPFFKADDEIMTRGNPSLGRVDKREQLLRQIYEASFVLDDIRLYMDTHPKDVQGLSLLKETVQKRKMLLKEFAMEYYPLTMDCMADIYHAHPDTDCYCWQEGPMPWEGACV